jgi:Xaa-Pro dipeptidase
MAAGKGVVPAISAQEYAHRREAVSAGLEASSLDVLVVFYPPRVTYLTGFHHVPTERPVALTVSAGGRSVLTVPAVEKEHAEQVPGVDLRLYFEYPGDSHPLSQIAETVVDLGKASPRVVGADHDGVVPRWGYRGPRLSHLLGHDVVNAEDLVESLRRVKSPAELACIQRSCEWADRAHSRMQAAIRTGRTEIECYAPAAVETLQEMIKAMPGWRPRGYTDTGLTAMFVGGRTTALPHGFVQGRGIQAGDVLVSGASADIDGYHSELERTMIVGDPSPEQERAFESMLALQERAIEVLRPGLPMAEVEREIMMLAGELGVRQHLRHHVGHSIGLEAHEAPFLDRGEEGVLEPGMVFTVEPGVDLASVVGFRHSDTVRITNDGCQVMTDYPRQLQDLIIPT